MASIYQNCMITLAATTSNGAQSGLFRSNANATDKESFAPTGNSDQPEVFLAMKGHEKNRFPGLEGTPELLTRGW